MGRIRRLTSELANQIAAGEVVERPASVVKELVENALDANATRIVVDIEIGGTTLVRVCDDGDGMSPEDAVLCLERHATSKIERFADLSDLGTFGFRGEALPSIASVSRFTLITRPRNSNEGIKVSVAGGETPLVLPIGTAVGTTIEVRDLFFNVPARRKFLKATATESAHVSDVLLGMALARHDVTFVLTRDSRLVREHLRVESRADRARSLLTGEQLVSCRGERGPVRIEALLAPPERARAGASGLSILVNGRPVRDRQLLRAISQAYGSVLEGGRYPLGVVWIDVPPSTVDVNVHPQKAEVRFQDSRALFDAVTRELHSSLARAFGLAALGNYSQAPPFRPHALPNSGDSPPPEEVAAARVALGPSLFPSSNLFVPHANGMRSPTAGRFDGLAEQQPAPVGPTFTSRSAHLESESEHGPQDSERLEDESSEHRSPYAPAHLENEASEHVSANAPTLFANKSGGYAELRYIGQVRGMFLLCEGKDALYILDQHAAAERVTFDRLQKAHASKRVVMQRLLVPEVVDLPAGDVALLEENTSEIARLGIEIRAVGESAVAVHGIPKLLLNAQPARLIRDLVAELSRTSGRPFRGAVDLILATMACHGSLRAGDAVSPEEITALLCALDEVDFAGHCPHGRPLLMRMTFSELERKVGR